ncbi:MAG: hypothetical protein C5B50_17040 [Verrucomicrobia bacterium]|nr:MAG: hypothetical protein C5B50_17040 [Verrucomicrobiota bacterium]
MPASVSQSLRVCARTTRITSSGKRTHNYSPKLQAVNFTTPNTYAQPSRPSALAGVSKARTIRGCITMLFLAASFAAQAAVTWWDPEGNWGTYRTYTGATSFTGSWESSKWATNDKGQTTTVAWIENTAAGFAVGAGATNSGNSATTVTFTITANSNHTLAGVFDGALSPNSATVTISGTGQLTLPAGQDAFDLANSSDSSLGYVTINNVLTGSGQITAEGNSQLFLNGNNTFSGGITLGYSGATWTGIVNFNQANSFGTGGIWVSNTSNLISALVAEGSSAFTIPNAIDFSQSNTNPPLNIVGNTAGITFSGNVTLGSKAVKIGSGVAGNLVILSGQISGSGSLTKFNPAELQLSGVNTYTGATTNSAFGGVGTLTINGSGSLGSGTYAGTIANNAGGTFNWSSSASQNFSGAIWGNTGTFNVNGPGTLTLSGGADNNALGATINNGGVLVLAKSSGSSVHALGATTTVNSGGTLRLGGTGGDQIFSGVNVTVNSGGVFDANGVSEGMTSLTLNGSGSGGTGALINNSGTASTITETAANGFPLGSATSVGGSGTLTMAGVISGAQALTKVGTGTVILTSTETYSGGTTISGGTLQIGNGGSGGSLTGDVVDNGNLSFNRTGSSYGGNISGNGTVTQAGTTSATLTLSGNNSYSGITFINAGAIAVGSATALGTTAGDTEVASGGTLEFSGVNLTISEPLQIAGAGSSSYNGVIDARSSATVVCSGPVTVNADSTLAVATGSTLSFNNASAFTASSSANLTVQGAGSGTIAGAISLGSGGLTKLQSGTWTIAGASSYSGSTTISAGTLAIGNGGTAGTLGSGAVSDNAALTFNRSDSLAVPNAISGTGSLSQLGGGTVTLSGPNGYGGGTTISSGTLAAGAVNTLPAGGAVNVSGGNLDIDGNNQSVGAVTLATGSILGTSGILSASSVSLQAGVVSAILDGSATVSKNTAGFVTMTRANTYTGDTTISGGTLILSGAASINNSPHITVTNGATFDVYSANGNSYSLATGQTLQGNGAVNGTVVVASGATVAPGTGTNTLYFTNAPVLQGTTAMVVNKTGSALTNDVLNLPSDTFTNGGTLTVNLTATSDPMAGGETFYLFKASAYSGSFSGSNMPALGPGLNWWLGRLNVDGSINVNHAPAAQDKGYSRAAGTSIKIAKADLLVGASDPDPGDSVSYDAVAGTGSQGATVTENATYIFYQPANNNADTIQYRLKDTRGGTVTKNIAIAVVNPGGLAQSIAWAAGGVSVTFAGIPGQAYDVQRADDADFTVNVTTLTTTNAPAPGIFTINDPSPPSPTGFYRTKQN